LIFAFKDRFPSLQPFWDKYSVLQERVALPAKTILLPEGKIAQNYYFVEKGCLRVCFDNKGKDTTVQFFLKTKALPRLKASKKIFPVCFLLKRLNRQPY
jgi:hypothetical protein